MAAAPAAAYPPGMSDTPRDPVLGLLHAIRAASADVRAGLSDLGQGPGMREAQDAGLSRRAGRPGADAGLIARRVTRAEA